MVDQKVYASLMKSGFPFQTAVAQSINAGTSTHRWSVAETEWPWVDPWGHERFLDIAISNQVMYATIECRKREGEKWIFLRPLRS